MVWESDLVDGDKTIFEEENSSHAARRAAYGKEREPGCRHRPLPREDHSGKKRQDPPQN